MNFTKMLPVLKPLIAPGLVTGEKKLHDYLSTIELLEGETDCRVVSEFDSNEKLHILICTFKNRVIARVIASFSTNDLIKFIQSV